MTPPEKLAAQVIDMQRGLPFQFLTSLLRFGSGWFANHAHLTRPSSRGCNRAASWAGSLSSPRSAKPIRNKLGMISYLLINTPLQRGVGYADSWQTVLTVCPPRGKPLKRFSFSGPWITRLKPGVNESCPAWDAEFPRTPA